MSNADHEFGSQSTEIKLSLVEAYLCAFTRALGRIFPELWYIDAFAGTGERTERIPGRRGSLLGSDVPESTIRRRGSAKIAIDVQPPFDRLIFVEIRKIIRSTNWQRIRAVMFLDPYGMSVEWNTLQAIAATQAIDVWYLFSLSGLYRQAAKNADAIDENKRAAITRVLGTDKWEKELYAVRKQPSFFDSQPRLHRTADVAALENYVRNRLNTIFPVVSPPLPLPINKRPQIFSLFFAISNPNPAAIKLATRIANHILKVGISSQKRSR